MKFKSIIALLLAPLVATLGLGVNNQADADIIINTPAGLAPGDTFRIVFVTDANTAATSTSIGTYNTFVNNDATTEAGGGSVTYIGTPVAFAAIASTFGEDAITNVGQSGSPVYLVDGTEVASSDGTSAGGLWSGSLLHSIDEDLNATQHLPVHFVWTGTDPFNGMGDGFTGVLGATTFSEYGSSYAANGAWAEADPGDNS